MNDNQPGIQISLIVRMYIRILKLVALSFSFRQSYESVLNFYRPAMEKTGTEKFLFVIWR